MRKCIGCGIILQNTFKEKLGYTKNLDNLYCERCFKTIHYNEEKRINNLDNYKIIDKINKLGKFTIFITDLVSINKKLIDIYKSINNEKILIINKCDIIPENVKLEHIEENIQSTYHIKEKIYFISAKKEMYLNKIINIIKINKEIILCGETSSGKSTLINKLIGSNLTTSKYNNTTLDFIKLKYLDYVIYDTPGILINELKQNTEKIVIKTKQINDKFVLNIGDLKINGNGNLTLFIPDYINVSSKKENIENFSNEKVLDNQDLVLDSGFIFIKKGMNIKINKNLEIRNSIIGR